MLQKLIQITHNAGKAILSHYRQNTKVDMKEDRTPLTQADRDAHNLIVRELTALTPEIPVLSEEGKEVSYQTRRNWKKFWVVDPLDGTKEFIKGSGEFTVNIALIEGTRPVAGVIHCPAKGFTYWAEQRQGAWYSAGNPDNAERISTQPADPEHMRIVASRDHRGPMVQKLVDQYPGAELTSSGSSIKFCLVAHGKADIYLRDVPTMEWDTAAAQIIVEEAGGEILTLDGNPLQYNKEILKNPEIITADRQSTSLWKEVNLRLG